MSTFERLGEHFRTVNQAQPIDLVPLYQILHNKYAVYWKVNPAKA